MRMTLSMKRYIENQVFAKVKARYDAAQEASKALKKRREEEIEAVQAYAKSLIEGFTAKVAAFAKKKFGLHFVESEPRGYYDAHDRPNELFNAEVCCSDFHETRDTGRFDKETTSVHRKADLEVFNEPARIADAAKKVSDRLIFEFELGKRAKSELDKAIEEAKVDL